MRTPALLATGLLLGIGPSARQEQTPSTFRLAAGDHDLRETLRAVARFQRRNCLLRDDEVGARTLTLQAPLELTLADCEAVVEQIAWSHGLALVPLVPERGVYEWVNVHGPRRGDFLGRAREVTPAEASTMRNRKLAVATVVAIQHATAGEVAQALRRTYTNEALDLTLSPQSNDLVLRGTADLVASSLDLVAMLDAPRRLPKLEEDRLVALERRVKALEEAQAAASAQATRPAEPPPTKKDR